LLGWLFIALLYVLVTSGLGIRNKPETETTRRMPEYIVKAIGAIMWGGLIAMICFLLYIAIFDRKNLP
jgi:hypothetical protein